MICKNCGKVNELGSAFCTQCGFGLRESAISYGGTNATVIKEVEAEPAVEPKFEQYSTQNLGYMQSQPIQNLFCIKCGASNASGTHFCIRCGFTLNRQHAQRINHNNNMPNHTNGDAFQPNLPYHMQAEGDPNKGKGMAVASLVLGIISLVCCGNIVAILAIIFGILGLKSPNHKSKAIAGLVLGVIGLIVGAFWIMYNWGWYMDIINGGWSYEYGRIVYSLLK